MAKSDTDKIVAAIFAATMCGQNPKYDAYLRLASYRKGGGIDEEIGYRFCKEDMNRRTEITNGLRMKELFDCKRGLLGIFRSEDDDPAKTLMIPVRPDTRGDRNYRAVCYRVMHELPFEPK
jgi:hypothetical protein